MSRMRVLQVNLHLTSEGCLVTVQEVGWKGHHRQLELLSRHYVNGYGFNAKPADLLHAVANVFDLRPASGSVPDSSL